MSDPVPLVNDRSDRIAVVKVLLAKPLPSTERGSEDMEADIIKATDGVASQDIETLFNAQVAVDVANVDRRRLLPLNYLCLFFVIFLPDSLIYTALVVFI
jgi:hypothetical protein